MLDIGKTNLFLNDKAKYVVSKLIDDYDLMGHNCLFLTHKNDTLQLKCASCTYTTYDSIPDVLSQNLFRVNIIVVESNRKFNFLLDSIREVTDLPVILVTDDLSYDYPDYKFDYIYKLYRQERDTNLPLNLIQNINRFEEDFLNNSHITDVKNNWNTSLSDLRTQYIRDKKINDLLK
jgi:hypothetical protein